MSALSEAEARLKRAVWLNDPRTQRVFTLLPGTRAVGGVVRDTILGRDRDNAEIDFATELLPEEVVRRAQAAGLTAHPTGIEHGTVTLPVDGLVAEVTTLREDIETYGRHARVRFGTDWQSDAERRDFTLNALYSDAEGKLLDPLGGLEDTLAGRVRFIGDPDQRIAEDRLRVYRFFRFSASHGGQTFDAAGLDACRRAADHLGRLSAERVGTEMRRLLHLPKVAATLRSMEAAGLLALGPERLKLLSAYEQKASPTLTGRLAIVVAASDAKTVQRRWRLSNTEISAVEAVLAAGLLLAEGRVNEAAYRYPQALSDALALATTENRAMAGRVPTSIPPLPISGRDLARRGYSQGPELGRELLRLEQAWIDSGFSLDRKSLLASVRDA